MRLLFEYIVYGYIGAIILYAAIIAMIILILYTASIASIMHVF